MVTTGLRPLTALSECGALGQAAAGVVLAGIAATLAAVLDSRGLLFAATGAVVVAGSAWLASTRQTQLALALFMVYLGALDGYLKLATGSSQVTLVRDVLLYTIVAGLLIRARAQDRRLDVPPLSGWVLGFVLVVLVQVANPHGGSLYHSLAGVRQHLEFIPLFFLGYTFVRTTGSLRLFVVVLLVIAAVNGIAGYVQFNLTPDQMAAWGPGYAELVRGLEGFEGAGRNFVDETGTARVRPFGLGGDAGSGGVLGALALTGAIALLSSTRRLRHQILVVALAVGAVAAVVTSQGRGVIVLALISVLAYVVLAATSRRRPSSLVALAVAGSVCALTVGAIVHNEGIDAFRYDSLAVSQILQTSTERPTPAAVRHAVTEFPLGAGLAVAGPASGSAGASQYTGTLNAESTYAFLIVETGLPGALLLVGFTLTLLFLGASRCRLEPDPGARALLAAIIAPVAGLLVLFYGGAVTSSVPTAPYLWFAGGIVSYWLVTRQRELRHGR